MQVILESCGQDSSSGYFNLRIHARCDYHIYEYFNPRIRTERNGNNINDFRIPIYNVQFLNQSLTQFRVCFMSYLGDFRCEPLRKFLGTLSSHQGGVEPPTFILILYTNLFICQGVIKILSFYFRLLEFPCFLVFFVVRTKEYF